MHKSPPWARISLVLYGGLTSPSSVLEACVYQIHQQDAELHGIAIGEERGEKRNMVKTAMGMLRENLHIEIISRITGLSVSEINKLKTAPSAN